MSIVGNGLVVPPWRCAARDVVFLPKRRATRQESIQAFGGPEDAFEKWIPQICGILNVKMVADTLGVSSAVTPYELTMRCIALGGFREESAGKILGVFHRPLLRLAKELNLEGVILKDVTAADIGAQIDAGRFVVLSLDLARVRDDLSGSHLVLVHAVSLDERRVLLHDNAEVLGRPGCNLEIAMDALDTWSNRKGLALWAD